MAYETKPFDCWNMAKEMRNDQFARAMAAKENGELLCLGGIGQSLVLEAFGDIAYMPGEGYGAEVALYPELVAACTEEVERRGFAGDICGYIRNYWGSAWLNRSPWGEFPKPDLAVESAQCDSHGKWYTTLAADFGIPHFVYNIPEVFHQGDAPEHVRRYIYEKQMELIEWLEKVTGKKCDDEKLCEMVTNRRESAVLWAQCCDVNKATPAPMDLKSMFTLSGPAQREGHSKRSVEFYHILLDELKDRVAKGIAAVANEKCRLYHDNIPPWHSLRIFRYMEQWGAVCVVSSYGMQAGQFDYNPEDKTLTAAKTFQELGTVPKTREEALQVEIELVGVPRMGRCVGGGLVGEPGREATLAMVKDWNTDGAIFHLNKGCEGQSNGRVLCKLFIEEAGIPTMTYEGSGSDPRDYNEAEVINRLDAFFESLGLKRQAQ